MSSKNFMPEKSEKQIALRRNSQNRRPRGRVGDGAFIGLTPPHRGDGPSSPYGLDSVLWSVAMISA